MKRVKWWVVGLALMLLAGWGMAQEAEVLRDIVLPAHTPDLLDWLLASKVVSVAKYASVITVVVQTIKALVVLFGSKLPPKVTVALTGLMACFVLWEQATADGQINGADWSALIVSFLSWLAAVFGYRLIFSAKSKVQQS